jgi:hypothetical protein
MQTNDQRPRCAVAIPARDEAGCIRACLEALAIQEARLPDDIVILVNNSTDGTAEIARRTELPAAVRLHVIETDLPPDQANAGHARRRAMQAALRLAGPAGVLLTTDADGQVDPDWLAANLACLRAGADAVAGWVELLPIDWGHIPTSLHEDDARERAYDALCDEMHSLLDPDPADPMPRHTQHSGASIAVTVDAYLRAGGVPPVPCGEDRALIAALRRVDARIRHAPEVHLMVSGRTEGRSKGGMAETIRRRLVMPDEFLDDRLEPAATCALRASARGRLRPLYAGETHGLPALAEELDLPVHVLTRALRARHFGMAWEAIEAASPSLARRRVATACLAQEVEQAEAILRRLRPARPFATNSTLDRAGHATD